MLTKQLYMHANRNQKKYKQASKRYEEEANKDVVFPQTNRPIMM